MHLKKENHGEGGRGDTSVDGVNGFERKTLSYVDQLTRCGEMSVTQHLQEDAPLQGTLFPIPVLSATSSLI